MKKAILLAILSILLTSCFGEYHITQDNWHINTLELADEYFPKYFDIIENSLHKNDIRYEKIYNERIVDWKGEHMDKYYSAKYSISETIYFTFSVDYNFRSNKYSSVDCMFIYNSATKEEMITMPQSYVNIMMDVTNFIAYNLLWTGDEFKAHFNEVKDKLQNDEYSWGTSDHFGIGVSEQKHDYLLYRSVSLTYYESKYSFQMVLNDYLTDMYIWDK